jgi:uncharacterized protein (DUF58 family)
MSFRLPFGRSAREAVRREGEERFRSALARVARRHDLVAIRLGNRATSELPKVGWLELLDPESGRRITVNTGSRRVRERYRKSLGAADQKFTELLNEVGASLVEVDTAQDPLLPIASFFRRRRG